MHRKAIYRLTSGIASVCRPVPQGSFQCLLYLDCAAEVVDRDIEACEVSRSRVIACGRDHNMTTCIRMASLHRKALLLITLFPFVAL